MVQLQGIPISQSKKYAEALKVHNVTHRILMAAWRGKRKLHPNSSVLEMEWSKALADWLQQFLTPG